MITLTMFGQK